ncbi:unnamed protein product [Malus baccata var. baccata]
MMERFGFGFGLTRLRSRVAVPVWLAIVAVMITMRAAAKVSRHDVGGSKINWKPGVNLSDWSSHETFYVGDGLYFGYEKHRFNVLEVNETNYENCIDTGFIKNITGGAGRDVFILTQAKTYYFLSSGGYCFGGLKVSVNVLQQLPPTPPPTSPLSGASSSASPVNPIGIVVYFILAYEIIRV